MKKYFGFIHLETDRLHTSLTQLNPLGVGRFSAAKPNLQQVSNDSDVRSLFIAGPGRKIVSADYSAIEMRIMAELSGDETLLSALFAQQDIHTFTAANMMGKTLESVTKVERQSAKAVNFGLIYGMSARTLKEYAENSYGVTMTLQEAEAARASFFRLYHGIKNWQDAESKKQFSNHFRLYYRQSSGTGYYRQNRAMTTTLDKRLRVFPTEQRIAQRTGKPYLCKVGAVTELYNTPDQGTGASIIKLAMSKVYDKLCAMGWEDVLVIMTLHDELVLSTPDEKASATEALLKEAMVEAWETLIQDTPIEVSTAVGDDWSAK